MRTDIGTLQDLLYRTPDTVCLERARLVTEAYRLFDGEPPHARAYLSPQPSCSPLMPGSRPVAAFSTGPTA